MQVHNQEVGRGSASRSAVPWTVQDPTVSSVRVHTRQRQLPGVSRKSMHHSGHRFEEGGDIDSARRRNCGEDEKGWDGLESRLEAARPWPQLQS